MGGEILVPRGGRAPGGVSRALLCAHLWGWGLGGCGAAPRLAVHTQVAAGSQATAPSAHRLCFVPMGVNAAQQGELLTLQGQHGTIWHDMERYGTIWNDME